MPSPVAWKPVAKAAVGFLLGILLWYSLSPAYDRLVAGAAEPLLHLLEEPNVTRLVPAEKTRDVMVDRIDFPPKSKRPGVPLPDLTFNVILLFALFASSRQTFSTRNVTGLALSLGILLIVHILILVVAVESIYAVKLGPWSVANYGPFARNFWTGTEHFYRVVGMYGIAFALWWLFRPQGLQAGGRKSSGSSRRRRRTA